MKKSAVGGPLAGGLSLFPRPVSLHRYAPRLGARPSLDTRPPLSLEEDDPKSYVIIDPHEIHENVQRRYSKKDLDELAKIELSLDLNGEIEEVEEKLKDVESAVLDRFDLLEKRITDALHKKAKSIY